MSSEVDLKVKEGIPHTGLYTSDQGAVLITNSDLQMFRVERGWIRVNNGVDVYRESGFRHGITYAGTPRVVGQITRAFVNMGELKLALGYAPTVDLPAGPGVLTGEQMAAFLKQPAKTYPDHGATKNWYPPHVDIQLQVNTDELPATPTTDPSAAVVAGSIQTVIAKNCIINNIALVFDSRGLITSGPIDFLGSSAQWRIDSVDTD